jgi:eukaryotic-like serine/threonine-protein kinase
MTLAPGTKLGHYEIHFQLGVGGMGEVYRARDSRLNRDVAIKILPQAFLPDPERLARFQREAQVLASLNHPNIAAIYGVEEQNGLRGLVLELVEGPTLADRIARGPIPLDEALAIAHKIAEALEAAHERSIVHRDLKPSNVKVTDDGTVKVLDFGLAKVFTDETPTEDFSHSPTLLKATHTGVILGTAAYMSPEQAKGKPVDKRADIWAFGAVLFEMLTGKRPFAGETLTDTLAAVVRAEPNWNDLPTTTPPSIRRLLRRCLTKDPKQRLRDIGDVKFDLESTVEQPSDLSVVPATHSKRWAIPLFVLVIFIIALATGAFVLGRLSFSASSAPVIIRFSDLVKSNQAGSGNNRNRFALSPDGSKLVYIADNKLHLRSFNTLETKEIPGAEGARGPFFSPDGQSIGFLITSQIKKLPLNGGSPVFIGGFGDVIGASWGRDDTILLGGVYSGILRVSAKGGKAETVVTPTPGLSYGHPQFLPDGRAFLYTRGRPGVSADNELVIRTLASGDETVVARGGFNYRYVETGHIIYGMGPVGRPVNLMAVAFDINSRKVIGSPVTVLSNVQTSNTGNTAQFSISDTGTLAYMPAAREPGAGTRLLTVSTSGQLSPIATEARDYSDPRISPDGHFLATHLQEDENDIWVTDIARGTLTRLSMDAGEDETPVWSPDGRFVAWSGSRADVLRGIFRRRADASGSEELIWKPDMHAHVRDWTPDGRALVLELADPTRNYDIWRLDLSDTPAATPFLQTQFNERCSRLSPDGHWLAYVSDESGRDEVYIQSFPQPGSKIQVSTSGGDQPVWSRQGWKLFFRGNGAIQEITFQPGSPPSVSKARSLFPDSFESPQAGSHTGYDVFPNNRFLMIQASSQSDAASEIVVVVNWTEELKRLIPREKE